MVVFSLTLVRHGETLANRENIIQGHTDVPLSDTGFQQARLVATRLQNEQFTHVFASDLLRATQTAQAIVEANVFSCSPAVQDKRLRERKFGVVEGKSFKDLAATARKHNVAVPNFTPRGAESIDQVGQRARSFFHDLCEHLLNSNVIEPADYIPQPIKRRFANSSLSSSTNPTQSDGIASKTRVCQSNTDGFVRNQPVNSADAKILQPRLKRVAGNREQNPNDGDEGEQEANSPGCVFSMDLSPPSFGRLSPRNCHPGEETQQTVIPTEDNADTADLTQTVIARSNSSSSSGCSSLPESAESQEREGELTTPTDDESKEFPSQDRSFPDPGVVNSNAGPDQDTPTFPNPIVSDAHIKTSITSARNTAHGCPNVSLSPLLEHRLSSVSSIGSGRNSSFDDADGIPVLTAEVLIVSHGGLLKELIRHFVDDLKCKIPGGKGHALRVCPNASLSKFTVTLEDMSELPVVTCLLIHDKEHLAELMLNEAERHM